MKNHTHAIAEYLEFRLHHTVQGRLFKEKIAGYVSAHPTARRLCVIGEAEYDSALMGFLAGGEISTEPGHFRRLVQSPKIIHIQVPMKEYLGWANSESRYAVTIKVSKVKSGGYKFKVFGVCGGII